MFPFGLVGVYLTILLDSWNMEHSLKHRFFAGMPLLDIRDDAAKYTREMKELQVQKPYNCTVFCLQATLNLIGESDYTSQLSGTEMKVDTKLQQYTENNDNLSIAVMRLFEFYLAFMFDDFGRTFEIRKEHAEGQIEKSVPGQFGLCVMYYCNAIAAISLYRAKGGAKYKRTACKLAKKVLSWASSGVSTLFDHSCSEGNRFSHFALRCCSWFRTPTSFTTV